MADRRLANRFSRVANLAAALIRTLTWPARRLGGLGWRIYAALGLGTLLAIAVTAGISWLIAARALQVAVDEVEASWLVAQVHATLYSLDQPLLGELERLRQALESAGPKPTDLTAALQSIDQQALPGSLVAGLRRADGSVDWLLPAAGDQLRSELDALGALERRSRWPLRRFGGRLLRQVSGSAQFRLEQAFGLRHDRLALGLVIDCDELVQRSQLGFGGFIDFFESGSSLLRLDWRKSREGQPPTISAGGPLPAEIIASERSDGSELDRFFVGSQLLRASGRTLGGVLREEMIDGERYRVAYRIEGRGEAHGWNGFAVGHAAMPEYSLDRTLRMEAAMLALAGALLLALLALLIALAVSRRISRPVLAVRDALQRIADGDLSAQVAVTRSDEIGQLQGLLNHTAGELRKRERMRELFGKYLSNQVAERVLADEGELGLAGQQREVSVLFADVRGFTTYSEQHSPAQVTQSLNEYFEVMVDVIVEHDGVLDKFIGDGLMVVFGAPVPQPDHALRAVRAAIAMQAALGVLNTRRQARGDAAIDIGIGVNSGLVISGNLGSHKRMEFTVIGDTVNLAARLEGKAGRGQILIGVSTWQQVRERVLVEPLGALQVKGKSEAVEVWQVLGLRT